MTNGSIRSLKFYCPTHRIRFQAPGQTVIPCEQGGHPVGSGFPKASWWEFCCDCETFWPADPANGNLQRTECLVCERPVAKRFLCTTCQVVSLESSALVRRKTYSIHSGSGITPNCPGCSTTANGQLQEHECAEASVRLLTSRSSCPFCENHLGTQVAVTSERPVPASLTACPFCGTQQKPGNRFCKRCGKPQPDAAQEAKAREEAVRREAEEAAVRRRIEDARQQAAAEAARLAEENRRREAEIQRRAEEERLHLEEARRRNEEQQRLAMKLRLRAEKEEARRAAEEEARRAAEVESERLRKEEEERERGEQARLRIEEAQRQQEEQQRLSAELTRRAEEEEAQRTAEEEARRVAEAESERLRKEEEERDRAEQERLRIEEAQRQQEEQQRLSEVKRRAEEEEAQRTYEEEARRAAETELERLRKEEEAREKAEEERLRVQEAQRHQEEQQRLTAELQRRAEEEEAQRTAETEWPQREQQVLTTADAELEWGTAAENETSPVAATGNEVAEIGELQAVSNIWDSAAPEDPTHQSSQLNYQADPGAHSPLNESKPSYEEDSFGAAAAIETAEFVKAPEYIPSWHKPSETATQPRRLPRSWIAGLLVLAAIGIIVTLISLTHRANIGDTTNVNRPAPTPIQPSVPVGMVPIPGGEFLMGTDRRGIQVDERPAHKVTVAPFYIDTTEVTCEDYEKFVKATGHRTPENWVGGRCPRDGTRKPVTRVDWYDASAYAKWANKRLPTEEEWEFAARGTTGWIYPWGNEWRKGAANADNAAKGVVNVGIFKGASPFQTYDMVGNAWEWTSSKMVPYPGGKLGQPTTDELRVIRGGSWGSQMDSATTTYRFGWPASGGDDYNNTSFRCAQDIPPPEREQVSNR